jgi:Icc-related predicted phosphoesterase
MIIDCISDLHGHYPELEGGDMLIVAGDLTEADTHAEYLKFYAWLHRQHYKHYIFIAGNHDNLIEKDEVLLRSLADTTYLCDSGTQFEYEEQIPHPCTTENVSIDLLCTVKRKLKIWGSPWTPLFDGVDPRCTAFMLPEAELEAKFAMIPDDVDILVTHGPPWGVLDKTVEGENVGSKSLAYKVGRMKKPPRLWCWGHIHESYGIDVPVRPLGTKMLNCSHVNERYEPVNKPIRVIF